MTDIKKAAIRACLVKLVGDDVVIDTTISLPHSEKGHMVVGETYEMYAPAAKGASENLGMIWDSGDAYSFTYAGTVVMQGELYVCASDVHYGGDVIPPNVQGAFDELRVLLGGASPICPSFIALKFIRPVTNE